MPLIAHLQSIARGLLRRKRIEESMDDEMRFHIEAYTNDIDYGSTDGCADVIRSSAQARLSHPRDLPRTQCRLAVTLNEGLLGARPSRRLASIRTTWLCRIGSRLKFAS